MTCAEGARRPHFGCEDAAGAGAVGARAGAAWSCWPPNWPPPPPACDAATFDHFAGLNSRGSVPAAAHRRTLHRIKLGAVEVAMS